jgi:hypothetical protein
MTFMGLGLRLNVDGKGPDAWAAGPGKSAPKLPERGFDFNVTREAPDSAS